MTIQVELINHDTSRSIEVIYQDVIVDADGAPTGELSTSLANIIEPERFQMFYLHSGRTLLIVER